MYDNMSMNDKPSETFLRGIKLALLRHCIMAKSEERLLASSSDLVLKSIKQKNVEQTTIKQIYESVINSINETTKTRFDRLFAIIEHMNAMRQDVKMEYQTLGNLQSRWDDAYLKIKIWELPTSRVANMNEFKDKIASITTSVEEAFKEASKIDRELVNLGEKLSKRAGEQISVILAASSLNQDGLENTLLRNPCEDVKSAI